MRAHPERCPCCFDAVVVGAGAAGLFCAAQAGQRGLEVLLIDHAEAVAEKIRISGGGRCNFTNLDTGPGSFDSANPDYCRSALARYTPRDFIALVEQHGIAWHEKHKGHCSATTERADHRHAARRVRGRQGRALAAMRRAGGGAERRGLSPGIFARAGRDGADRGRDRRPLDPEDRRQRLGLRPGAAVRPRRDRDPPGLVPLVCAGTPWQRFEALSGVALPVRIAADGPRPAPAFDEDLLFTHRGLSGPAALQISTFWRPGESVTVDLVPGVDLGAAFRAAKSVPGRRLGALLAELMPRRLAEACSGPPGSRATVADRRPRPADLAAALRLSVLAVSEAIASRGPAALDTRELDSRSGQSRRVAGLYFIGEVVDVTGWLGGYNFQWAWASAAACARALGPVYSTRNAGL